MSLEGAKFICLDEAGNHGEIVLAKGRKFTMGYYVSCDFVLVDERAKGVHCEIECDAFGRVTIRNLSPDKPVFVNGSTVEIKRILLHNSKLSILDKDYLWLFPKVSSNEFEDLPIEAASTPQKQIGIPEQPPNSCPDFKLHREVPKRFTVHNFAYCIQSDEEGNSNDGETSQKNQIQNEIETEIKQNQIIHSKNEDNTQEKDLEKRNRSITPEPKKQQNEKSTNIALMETPKMNLINCTKDKENKSTQKKNKQLLTMCNQSDVVITSFSPRETGVRIEKSFATIVKPKVLVTKTPATPKSVYSTPKSDLNKNDDAEDGDEKELMTFHTPSTSKKVTTTTTTAASTKVLKNSSMHLIDLTTPNKIRPASPYLKSALKASAKKQIPQTTNVNKSCSKLSSEQQQQLGLSALPSTPVLSDNSNSALETPSSVISVSSSTDTSSIIEVTSDGSNIGITPVTSATGMTTPLKAQTRAGAFTPKRTPQSLIKRVLISSAKKQNTTPQRNIATTPRRESINRIPLRSNLALLRTPVTPQTSVGDKSTSQLPRRQSMSTPTRKSVPARSRLDSSPSTSNLASPSSSNKMLSRRSSINPISAAKALPTSTPVSGSSNNSASRTRAACKTSPLHKVRKSIGGIPLSSHISKARRSIVLPASTSKITSIKEKSPQQVMCDRLVTRARKSLCLTPISARSRNMVTAAKTPPKPSSILKAKSTQSARKPEQKAVLFADKQPAVRGEVDDLSRTFIIDSDEEENVEKQEDKPKDVTFSPEKEAKETEKLIEKEIEKKQDPIEIPVDVEEVTSFSKENKELEQKEDIKRNNEENLASAVDKKISLIEIEEENEALPEESFAEIIIESQEINEITDNPKETSQTESQENFSDALDEIVEENVIEIETNEEDSKEEPVETLTHEKSEVVETGFGEESIVEIIETSNSENVVEEIIKSENTTSNIENGDESTDEQRKETEKESPEKEVVESETKTEETESLEVQEFEDKIEPKLEDQKPSIYKPIVEDITLEGSLIEKETNVSKQPLNEFITFEGSLIEEEKVKSNDIKDESSKESNESSKVDVKQDEEASPNISQEPQSSTIQETNNIKDVISGKNNIELTETKQNNAETMERNTKEIVLELSETNQNNNEETLEENIEEKSCTSKILDQLPTTKIEGKTSTIFIEKLDDDLDDTSKLLEEIEDVLNKSDEIKQKHLVDLEEGKQESEKPLTEEFESEKLSEEIIEETKSTSNEENNEIPVVSKEADMQEKEDSVEQDQESNQALSYKELSKSSENIAVETDKTEDIPKLSTEIDSKIESPTEISKIVSQNENNVESNEHKTEALEIVVDPTENNISKEESVVTSTEEISKIKETEIIIQKQDSAEENPSTEEEDISNKRKTEVVAEETSESNESIIAEDNEKSEEQNQESNISKTGPITLNDDEIQLNIPEKSETKEIENTVQNEEKSEELESNETENIQNDENAEEPEVIEIIQSKEKNIPQENAMDEEKIEKQPTKSTQNQHNLGKQSVDSETSSQKQNTESSEEKVDKIENTVDNLAAKALNKCEELKTLENIVSQAEENTSNEEKTELSFQYNSEEQIIETKQKERNVLEKSVIAEDSTEDEDTKISSEIVKQAISSSETYSEQKKVDSVTDLKQMNKSEENIERTDKSQELSLTSVTNRKKIENASSLTPRRSTRRASMSAEATQTITPKRSTRRASMSADSTQSTAIESSSFTPRRSARRASMSAETTSAATPTKKTTRRASLSVVSETPLTPKAITKRRASLSVDDEINTPSTSKTSRKQLEQRTVIPEEIEQVIESVIIEEEDEPVEEIVQIEEKKNEKKRRTSSSNEPKTPRAKTPLKQLKSLEKDKVVTTSIIEEEEEESPEKITMVEVQIKKQQAKVVESNKEKNNEKDKVAEESLSKESLITAEPQEEPENPTDVTNLAEKETQIPTKLVSLVSEQKSENIEKHTTALSDILTLAATNEETLEQESLDFEQKQKITEKEKADEVEVILEEDAIAKSTINENEIGNTKKNKKEADADDLHLDKMKEESVIEQDVFIDPHEKLTKEVKEELTESSTKLDEVDKVHTKDDNSIIIETSKDNVEKSSDSPKDNEVVDSSETSKEIVDLNTSQKSADDYSEDEMENLQFEDDVEKTPTKETTTTTEISTPAVKKSVEIFMDSPKTPLMVGMRDLLKTPKAEQQTPCLGGIRDLVRTPKVPTESKQEEMEKFAAVADLVKTPKAAKETNEISTPKTKKKVTIVADSPKTPLMSGMRELFNTPKSEMPTPQIVGLHNLVKTPKTKVENEEESEKLAVVAELIKTPQANKNIEESVEEMPCSSMRTDNLQGIKELLKTPKSCSTPRFKGMRELMQTPKISSTPILGGVKELLDSSAIQENSEILVQQSKVVEAEEIPCTSSKTTVNLKGVKELLKTPKSCSTPRLKGLRELMQTPKMSSTPIMGGIKELMDTTAPLQKDQELEKFLKTPTAKNIMIPSMPSSAIIEKSNDSIEISTEYNLNATHDGSETENLEELFKTPVASRFVERITDSYYGEEGNEHDETVEKFNKTKNESLEEALNKSAEEAFDKLVGQETQIQTPIRKIYNRKSFALQTPQAQSPFSAADVLSDLPKTDVEEWIETLDQAEPPSMLECDDNDEIVEEDIVSENVKEEEMEEVSVLAENISANDASVIPETCTKVYLTEKSLTDITTASITKIETKDPLLSTTAKLKEKETRSITPLDAEISGINLLDQTVESIQDEQLSMLDEPLLVEEPSIFEEPLVVSDDESECNNTLNNAEVQEISQDEANDLSEPLMLSDSEDLNQSQEFESNEPKTKQEEFNLDENVQEKSMTEKVLDVSITEDPLVVEAEDKSIIEIKDESIENETSKVDELPKETQCLEEDQSFIIEETPMKAKSTIDNKRVKDIEISSELQTESNNHEEKTQSSENSEEEFATVVESTETNVIKEPEQIVSENIVKSKENEKDAKEISIEETNEASEDIFLDSSVTEICEETNVTSEELNELKKPIETNKSEDIFLDTSVTEICEETSIINEDQDKPKNAEESPEIEHNKSVVKETKQHLDHECHNIFMDNSNIDESFADEAANEENDVENESAMVEVTTKEAIKEHSFVEGVKECSGLDASKENKTVEEIEEVFGKVSENSSENVIKECTNHPQVEETETLIVQDGCSEKEVEQTEETPDIMEEQSSFVIEDLESSNIVEDQSELGEFSIKPSESSKIKPVYVDEKQAENVKSDTAAILEQSQVEDHAELSELLPEIETKSSEFSEMELESTDTEADIGKEFKKSITEEQTKLLELAPQIETKSSENKKEDNDTTSTGEELESSQMEKQIESSELSIQTKTKSSETSAMQKETEATGDIGEELESSRIEEQIEFSDTKPSETSEIHLTSSDEKEVGETSEIGEELEIYQIEEPPIQSKSSEERKPEAIANIGEEAECSRIEEQIEFPSETSVIQLKSSDEKEIGETAEINEEVESSQIKEQAEMSEIQPQIKTMQIETSVVQLESLNKNEPEAEIGEELESSQIVDTAEEQSELSELSSQIKNEPNENVTQTKSFNVKQTEIFTAAIAEKVSEVFESSQIENNPITIESSDDKVVEASTNETLEFRQETLEETPSETSENQVESLATSEDKVEHIIDDKLSETLKERPSSREYEEELKDTPSNIIEENFQCSSSTDTILTEDKETSEVKTSPEIIKEKSVSNTTLQVNQSLVNTLTKDQIETDILIESSESKHKQLSKVIVETVVESEESSKSRENVVVDKVTSVAIEMPGKSLVSEKDTTIISEEMTQQAKESKEMESVEEKPNKLPSLTEEKESMKSAEKLQQNCEEKSKSAQEISSNENLSKSSSELKESYKSIRPSEIIKSFFEVIINDTEHKNQKETVLATSEKPVTSLRKRKGSQTTESTNTDSELPATRRTRKNTKIEEIIEQTKNEAKETETVEEPDLQKSKETVVESIETLKHEVVKVSEKNEVVEAEVSSIKTSRRQRTVSESSQNSTQGEESHSRSRRDRRNVIKKQSAEKLEEVKEELQISKSEVLDEKPKRKRTTSESSQGSVKDEDSAQYSAGTRRGRRKVQKTPSEETVIEQKEESEEVAVEKLEHGIKPEEFKVEVEKTELISSTTEEIVAENVSEVEKVSTEEFMAEKQETILEELSIKEENDATSTKGTLVEEINSEIPIDSAAEINVDEKIEELPLGKPENNVKEEKPEAVASDKIDKSILSDETSPPMTVEQQKSEEKNEEIPQQKISATKSTDSSSDITKETTEESSKDTVLVDDISKLQEPQTDEIPVEEISETPDLSNAVHEAKSKLSDIIELTEPKKVFETTEGAKETVEEHNEYIIPEPEEVTEIVQEIEEVTVTVEETKQQPIKRGRRKPNASESSQGSVHDDDNTRSRKTRRKVQKTPVEEAVLEEIADSEEVATTATSNKKVYKKVHKTLVEEIVPEENEEDLTSQPETSVETLKQMEDVSNLNKETNENLNENTETEAAEITLPEVPAQSTKDVQQEQTSEQNEINEHPQELLEMEVVVEEIQETLKQTHVEHEDTKKHGVKRGRRKRLPEKLPEEATTSRRGRRKVLVSTTDELPVESAIKHKNLSFGDQEVIATVNENEVEISKDPHKKLNEECVKAEELNVSMKQQVVKRCDIEEVPTADDIPVEPIVKHENLPIEAGVIADIKSTKLQNVPVVSTDAIRGCEEHEKNLIEGNIKQEKQLDVPTKQTAKRGGRRKVVEDLPVETSVKVENTAIATYEKPTLEKRVEETSKEILGAEEEFHVEASTKTSHATKRGGRHKGVASETTIADVPKVRSASRNRKTPADHSSSEPELSAVSEKLFEKVDEMSPASPDIPKGRSASQNRKTPAEHSNGEDQLESQKQADDIPELAEVPKGRAASRNRKAPVEHPTTSSNQQEEQIESIKELKEISTVAELSKGRSDSDVVIIDDSTDDENENKQEDKFLTKGVKRTRNNSETNQGSVVDEKPTKRQVRHQETEITENIEETKQEIIEEVHTGKAVLEKPQKSTRRRGAAAIHEEHNEAQHGETSTKSRRRPARQNENEEQQYQSENIVEIKSTEEISLSQVKITEVSLEPEDKLDQQAPSQNENQKDVKIRKGRRKVADEEHHQDEEQKSLAAVKRKALAKEVEHDHEVESAPTSKRRVARKNRDAEEQETEEKQAVAHTESSENVNRQKEEDHDAFLGSETTEITSTELHVGGTEQDHDELAVEKHNIEEETKQVKRRHVVRKKVEQEDDHGKEVPEKQDTEEKPTHIENSETTNKRRHVGRKKLEHGPEHDHHEVETEHPQEEAKKGRTRRKKVDYTEEPDQPTTSHSPETKQRGRKRKESHTETHDHVSNEKDHTDEKSSKENDTKVVNPSTELQTPQRVAPIAKRGRKASTIEHITAESQELVDDTPARRARNVPQRRAATAYHNYDETSDSEVTTKTKKKTDSPRKSLEPSKSSPTATITSAPIIDTSPSPSSTTATTTARGRTRKPTAKVQQFLEEERAKAETPKKRGLLAAVEGATPQRTPVRRGRKASTIETVEVEGTPQASKGRGKGRQAVAPTKEEHIVAPETTAVVEEKEVELHTTPPLAQPVKGRRGGRKAKITEEEPNANCDEPPAKKSPLELESEKQDSSPSVEAPTPPTRTAGKRNAAAAAKARIEEDALAAAAIDPPKRSRTKKAPAKVATPVVAIPDTDAHSSELEEEKGAKNKISPQKRDHRLASASTIEGADELEDDHNTETADKPANKRLRKATATIATPTTDLTEVPVKRSRKAKIVEDVADSVDTPGGEPKATRGRGRGRRNVHFDEHQEAETPTTSTQQQQQQQITNIEPTTVETPEPVKKAGRPRRK